ncbi:hypothetical protein [Virgibacillus pantothenticus]|uniref:hypothetical protein n=1 Tax=Virgibacillus pantothenticus TaxID=1473 RepID=UPI000985A02B|nr:hypothetical protein [Virgibacillus pantothenticus]
MLQFENVSIKGKNNIVIKDLTCNIPNQSIFLLKNEIKSKHFVTSIVGKRSLENGKIYIDDHFIKDNQIDNFPFFVISEDIGDYWINYKLIELTKLFAKYNGKDFVRNNSFSKYFSALSPVQKLKYFIDLGKSINRKILILENPVESLDYDDMEEFCDLMLNDLTKNNFIIIDRKMNEVYKNLKVPVYHF